MLQAARMSLSPPIRFGIFEVDPEHGEVRRQGVKISLQDQPLQVLLALLARAPHVVTREDLKKMLWPADTFVDFERGLNRAISRLRDALRDVADSPRFIETLPRRGYRFIAPVSTTQAEVSEASLVGGAPSVRPHEGLPERSAVAVLPSIRRPEEPPGGDLSHRCPSCGHPNSAAHRFCAACGGHLGRACASCGTPNNQGESFCGACGTLLSGAAAEGERRQLTVLFCDLVGATAITERLDPEDWREIASRYQRAAAETVARFGGHLAKYVGDGLVIYFGYPAAHEDDPERAVRAGLALIDTVAGLNRDLDPGHGVRLAVRVGMHTGVVVLGPGVAGGTEVYGDTPNVAARVQGLAEPDTVLLTEATHRLVSGRFIVEAKGAATLKGVQTTIAVYRAVLPRDLRSRHHAASARGLTPFVGRESERRLLVERWEQASTGGGQAVLVMGEAGIGKSRLVQNLKEHLASEPHTWIECHGSVYHQNTPFHAVVDMLHAGLGGRAATSLEERVEALERWLQVAGIALPDAMPLVAPLLGLPVPDRYPPLGLSPEAQRKKLLTTLATWLVGLAGVQPVVAVIEDLHWADPSTLELQAMLVEHVATAPVLLVYTARAEFRPPWPLLAHHTLITLNRLSDRDIRAMIASVAAEATLGDELIETLVNRTDGVPLFVEELTKAVLESGDRDPGRSVPATLEDSLMARLDRLGPTKEVAQTGAVIGREFSWALLRALSRLPELELQRALTRLTDAELLYARGVPPEATFVFKHALVQDAAYASLLKSRRREIHREIARVLAEGFPETAEVHPELLASHYEAGGLVNEAVTHYQRAGAQAATQSSHEEAIQHFRRAATLLGSCPKDRSRDARELELQLALAPSLVAARGYAHQETAAAWERARTLAEALGDAARVGDALVGMAVGCYNRAELDRTVELAAEIVELGRQTGDETYLLCGYKAYAMSEYYRGRFALALEHCERAAALYDPRRHAKLALRYGGDQGVGAHAYAASTLGILGFPDRARNRARETILLARTLAHPVSIAMALQWGTVLHWHLGDVESQRELAAESVTLGESEGLPFYLGIAMALRGAALAASGNEQSGMQDLTQGLALLADTGSRVGAPAFVLLVADTHRSVGQHAEALVALERALDVSAQTGQPFVDAEILHMKGEVLVESGTGDAADAEQCFHRALAMARSQGAKICELRTATGLARLWLRQGRRSEARALLAPAFAWFTEGFDTRHLREAKALLEDIE
jgi:class 3 adenylate cyclase/DNA-binding winged helix-turn-helix (wHTH) protein/tetratricopeptide (TPR) repeat protein